jgi:hypothetical protein
VAHEAVKIRHKHLQISELPRFEQFAEHANRLVIGKVVGRALDDLFVKRPVDEVGVAFVEKGMKDPLLENLLKAKELPGKQ